MRRVRRFACAATVIVVAAGFGTGWLGAHRSARAATITWEPWFHLAGVFDVAGPRSDGRLVAAVGGGLALVDPAGTQTPFAAQYRPRTGPESYIVVSPGLAVERAGCRFAPDDVFALALDPPLGIVRISARGAVSRLADLAGTEGLSGIAFDTGGAFGHRLLVAAKRAGATVLVAVDCRGRVQEIGAGLPAVEGGIQVAPKGFGPFAGQLVAADELTGDVWAFDQRGRATLVVHSGVAAGADIGVESVGFVPPGFFGDRDYAAYLADRSSPGSPTAGTDTILRLTSAAFAGAGVRAGDLLVATESAARTIAVRCTATCTSALVASDPAAAHPEGRITFTTRQRQTASGRPDRKPSDRAGGKFVVAGVVVVSLAAAFAIRGRRRGHDAPPA